MSKITAPRIINPIILNFNINKQSNYKYFPYLSHEVLTDRIILSPFTKGFRVSTSMQWDNEFLEFPSMGFFL